MIYRCNFMLEDEDESVKSVYKTLGLYEINKGRLFLRAWCFIDYGLFRKPPIQDKRIYTISDAILPHRKDLKC